MKVADLKKYGGKLQAFIIRHGKRESRVVAPTDMQIQVGDRIFTERCSGVSNGYTGWAEIIKEIPLDDQEVIQRMNIQIVHQKEDMPLREQYLVWAALQNEAKTWALIQGEDPSKVGFLGDEHLLSYARLTGLL